MKHFVRTLALATLVGSSFSCASMLLKGAEIAQPPTGHAPRARYTVSSCKDVAGVSLPISPSLRYELYDGETGPELYELASDGSSSRIINQWRIAGGYEFFTWVKRHNGWSYTISDDGRTGTRHVYLAGQYRARPDGDAIKVKGVAALTCPMTRL